MLPHDSKRKPSTATPLAWRLLGGGLLCWTLYQARAASIASEATLARLLQLSEAHKGLAEQLTEAKGQIHSTHAALESIKASIADLQAHPQHDDAKASEELKHSCQAAGDSAATRVIESSAGRFDEMFAKAAAHADAKHEMTQQALVTQLSDSAKEAKQLMTELEGKLRYRLQAIIQEQMARSVTTTPPGRNATEDWATRKRLYEETRAKNGVSADGDGFPSMTPVDAKATSDANSNAPSAVEESHPEAGNVNADFYTEATPEGAAPAAASTGEASASDKTAAVAGATAADVEVEVAQAAEAAEAAEAATAQIQAQAHSADA